MRSTAILLATLAVAGCQTGLDEARSLEALDEPFFRCKVQPVLTKNCGALACHGDGRRFFRLFGRNRLRLGGTEAERNAPLRDAERASNYDSARAFIDADDPALSLLLRKPLDEAAGGYYHGGATEFGKGNVFGNPEEPELQLILRWIRGAKEDAGCIEPGSNL